MDDTKKMLTAIINGQSAMKQELLTEIKKVDKKVDNLEIKVEGLRIEMKEGFKKTNSRIDNIGLKEAELEDDTPTRDEFDALEERVGKLKTAVAPT